MIRVHHIRLFLDLLFLLWCLLVILVSRLIIARLTALVLVTVEGSLLKILRDNKGKGRAT